MQKVLGALGWSGIACVVAGIIVRFAMPEQEEVWYWALMAGIVLIVLYGLGQWRDILGFWGHRQARYGALASTSVVLAVGILVATNFVLARQNKRWDLTAAKQYSLAAQTVQILESLESPLRMLVFAQDADFPRHQDQLAEYEYTSSQVTLEFVDPDKNPVQANQYEVQAYNTIVLEYEDRIDRVVNGQEQELTNALIKVIEGRESKVYFVQGHGEKDPENSERDGYSAFSEALRLDNLAVDNVVLAQTGNVPPDASVVVVAGPSNDFLPGEIDILRTYLESGGKVLLLLDPADDPAAADQSGLIALAAEWGIEIGQDVVVDVSGVGQLLGTDVTVPVAATYPPHPIVDDFALLTAYPLARSVKPIPGGADGRVAVRFVETSPRSWAETNMAELAGGEVEMTEGEDAGGPISIAAAVSVVVDSAETEAASADTPEPEEEDSDAAAEDDDAEEPSPPEARLAVVGDSDFASTSYLGIQGNRDLALNAVNWLAQQENLISIRPRSPEDRRITLTAAQQRNLNWLTLLMIPALIFGVGIHTWWRRRT